MKKGSIIRSLIVLLVLLAPFGATARTSQTSDTSGSNSQPLKPEQLDQLVAPIALYPDTLIAPSPAISRAAAAPMSEVIAPTKVKKSPTTANNGRRRMLDLRNVRAVTRGKKPPARTADLGALRMPVQEG